MSEASDLAARLAARQHQDASADRSANAAQTLQAVDQLWPLADRVRRELQRTDYPTISRDGVYYSPVVIDGQDVPAWRLSLRIRDEGRYYATDRDYITFDGRLVYFWRQLVSGDPRDSSSGPCVYEPRLSYPTDEIHEGHRQGWDMSKRPVVIRLGLEYLLETLQRL